MYWMQFTAASAVPEMGHPLESRADWLGFNKRGVYLLVIGGGAAGSACLIWIGLQLRLLNRDDRGNPGPAIGRLFHGVERGGRIKSTLGSDISFALSRPFLRRRASRDPHKLLLCFLNFCSLCSSASYPQVRHFLLMIVDWRTDLINTPG
jgi:hypothetical protein